MYISTPSESMSAQIDGASIVSVNNACLIEIDYLSVFFFVILLEFCRKDSLESIYVLSKGPSI